MRNIINTNTFLDITCNNIIKNIYTKRMVKNAKNKISTKKRMTVSIW